MQLMGVIGVYVRMLLYIYVFVYIRLCVCMLLCIYTCFCLYTCVTCVMYDVGHENVYMLSFDIIKSHTFICGVHG